MLYHMQEDWIGMRTLHEAGKLEFGECPGDHMHFNLEWWVHSSVLILPLSGVLASGI